MINGVVLPASFSVANEKGLYAYLSQFASVKLNLTITSQEDPPLYPGVLTLGHFGTCLALGRV